MKAILNLPAANKAYKQHNGQTFDVVEVRTNTTSRTAYFTLDIEGTKTDFTNKEVIIVDVENELEQAWLGNDAQALARLQALRYYKQQAEPKVTLPTSLPTFKVVKDDEANDFRMDKPMSNNHFILNLTDNSLFYSVDRYRTRVLRNTLMEMTSTTLVAFVKHLDNLDNCIQGVSFLHEGQRIQLDAVHFKSINNKYAYMLADQADAYDILVMLTVEVPKCIENWKNG